MGGGIRPPAYFATLRGRILERAHLLSNEELAIAQMVAEKQIESSFSFLPFTTNTAEVYQALDIVTFPNQGVGLGRPVLEAAVAGKPVVASGSIDGGGILVPERTGILLADSNPASLAAALRRLVLDADLRASDGGGRRRARRGALRPRAQRARGGTPLRPPARDPGGGRAKLVSGSGITDSGVSRPSHERAPRLADPVRPPRIVEEVADRRGEGFGVSRLDEQTGLAFVHELRDSGESRRDARGTKRHRLHQRDRNAVDTDP